MSVTLNAKGTSVPFFTIGKNGTTVYQGASDPQSFYSLKNSDLWLDTSNSSLKMWSTSTSGWIAPKIGSTDVTTIIPSQTGNSGKFLTTDGTNVSWGTVSTSGTITLTGDVTGSGTGTFATTLATVNASPQTDAFRKITVNAKGLVTATTAVSSGDVTTALGYTPYNSTNPNGYTSNTGTVTSVSVTSANGVSGSVATATTTPAITLSLGAITPTSVAATGSVSGSNLSGTNTGDETTATIKSKLGITTLSGSNTGDQTITLTGDVTGSGTGSFAATLATVNAAPQTDTFRKITVNAKGLVTATTAVGSTDITTALGYTPYNSTNPNGYTSNTGTVTSIDVSGGTTGLTTSGGPVTASGTITLAGTLAVANGGTGQTTYTNGQLLIGNSTGNTLTKSTLTAGNGVIITNGAGSINIAANISALAVTTPTTNYSVTALDGVILANGAITVTLPTAATAGAGKTYLIKKINSTGTVSVVVSGGGVIDDGTTANITVQYTSISVISDGTKYWII